MSTPNGFHLALFGPPGAGKGTQAQRLSGELGVPHISTGEILRAEVAQGTDLGRRAKDLMDGGDLVTDDLMLDLVRSRLHLQVCRHGFNLDEFPRSCGQSVCVETFGGYDGSSFKVVSLEVPQEELVQR